MKYLFITLILFTIALLPQSNWQWINPLPTGNTLNKVVHLSANTAVAVGDAGTIIKTTNGGDDWYSVPGGTLENLNSVFFLDSLTGWICGTNILALKTTDGGETWQNFSVGTPGFPGIFKEIHFFDSLHGAALNSKYGIYRTTDGGSNWIRRQWGYAGFLKAFHPIDFDNYYITGDYGNIIKTTNGGISFTYIPLPVYADVTDIHFFHPDTGFVTTTDDLTNNSYVLKTTDGGISWDTSFKANVTGFSSISFWGRNHAWLTDFGSWSIRRTTDGGLTWLSTETPNHNQTLTISPLDTLQGLAAGQGGIILRTTSGGQNWSIISKGHRNFLSRVIFSDSLTGWACGEGMFKTTDGGQTWNQKNSFGVNDLFFLNNNLGWTVSGNGYTRKTTDGGESWNTYLTGNAYSLYSVYFCDSLNGWACGEYYVKKTTDGGVTWSTSFIVSYGTLTSIHFFDLLNGVVIGYTMTNYPPTPGAVTYFTSDGGVTWTESQSPLTSSRGASFIDSLGWVATGSTLHFTQNRGRSWSWLKYLPKSINNIFFLDKNTGFIAAAGGSIYKTTDGGTVWNDLPSITSNALYDVFFLTPEKGFAVGQSGTMIAYYNNPTSVNDDLRQEKPNSYLLSQNYPNPFNPTTVISYQLPVNSNVSLRLYDILGNEVARLVDEMQDAGRHEVEFNGSRFPSGVYFYQLRAGGFVETRKMILLK